MKIIDGEVRLKYDIQNNVPAPIDHTNVAFQSASEMFIGVDWSRYTVSTFPFSVLRTVVFSMFLLSKVWTLSLKEVWRENMPGFPGSFSVFC
jgi:hypothetical protein